jgi:DNA-binding transcriptional LysR family regulator
MLNLTHLSSFIALQQTGSFTLAAARLGLSQSTVSQHLQRLEDELGKQLIWRTTHAVRLTPDGELLIGHARDMVEMDGRIRELFNQSRLRGRLRLGVSEDFVATRLSAVLENFIRLHPLVDLELTVDLSGVLYEKQGRGELDLVLAKRMKDDARGRLLYREPLVWMARSRNFPFNPGDILPLIAYPPPSITRRVALEALESHGIAWRIVCTCPSLTGLMAAARAGMGVLVQPRSMVESGLEELGNSRLPQLEHVDFVLVPSRGADAAIVEAISNEFLSQISAPGRER